jgi:hypothetical protein
VPILAAAQNASLPAVGLAWTIGTALLVFALSYLHLWLTDRNRKLYAPLHPLYDERGNQNWASRDDLNKLGAKLNAAHDEIRHTSDRVDGIEKDIGLIRQAQMFTHQEMMDKLGGAVATLDVVVREVKEVSGNQRAQAEQLRIILNRKDL